jgi:Zn-dependent M28 family amino/carboxypeptidase
MPDLCKKWLEWIAVLIMIWGTMSACAMTPTSIASPIAAASEAETALPGVIALSDRNFSSQAVQPIANPPQIDASRLLNHLESLSFERYNPADRDRARRYLTQTLEMLGWSTILQSFEGGINVVAERSGTDPQAGTLLVGAHYDTVKGSPGADDNASAVAVILEIARLLRSRPTPRTLKLVFFDLEEQGLRGSLNYVATDEQIKDLRGAVILEMLGYACYMAGCQQYPEGLPISPPSDRGDFLAIVGNQEHLRLLNAFQATSQPSLPPTLTLAVPLKGLLMPDLLRSDHAPFWYQGIGAVMVTDTANFRNPHYHQPSDTLDTIDQKFLTGAAQLIANTIAALLEDRNDLTTQKS